MNYRDLSNLFDDEVQCNEVTTSDHVSSLSSIFRRPFSGASALEPRVVGNQSENEINNISNERISSETSWRNILNLMRSVRRMQMREQELRNRRMREDAVTEAMNRPMSGLSLISYIKDSNTSNMIHMPSLINGIDNLNNDRSTRRLERDPIHNSSDGLQSSSQPNMNSVSLPSLDSILLPKLDLTSDISEPEAGPTFENDFNMPRNCAETNLKSKSNFSYPQPPKYISLAGEKKLPRFICSSAEKKLLESDTNSSSSSSSRETEKPVTLPKKRLTPKKFKDFTPPQVKWFNDIANRKGHILSDNSELYPVGPPKSFPNDNATLSKTYASRSQDDLISSDIPWFNQEAMKTRKIIKGKRLITQKSESDLTTRF